MEEAGEADSAEDDGATAVEQDAVLRAPADGISLNVVRRLLREEQAAGYCFD
jgi:hypothetical protein